MSFASFSSSIMKGDERMSTVLILIGMAIILIGLKLNHSDSDSNL